MVKQKRKLEDVEADLQRKLAKIPDQDAVKNQYNHYRNLLRQKKTAKKNRVPFSPALQQEMDQCQVSYNSWKSVDNLRTKINNIKKLKASGDASTASSSLATSATSSTISTSAASSVPSTATSSRAASTTSAPSSAPSTAPSSSTTSSSGSTVYSFDRLMRNPIPPSANSTVPAAALNAPRQLAINPALQDQSDVSTTTAPSLNSFGSTVYSFDRLMRNPIPPSANSTVPAVARSVPRQLASNPAPQDQSDVSTTTAPSFNSFSRASAPQDQSDYASIQSDATATRPSLDDIHPRILPYIRRYFQLLDDLKGVHHGYWSAHNVPKILQMLPCLERHEDQFDESNRYILDQSREVTRIFHAVKCFEAELEEQLRRYDLEIPWYKPLSFPEDPNLSEEVVLGNIFSSTSQSVHSSDDDIDSSDGAQLHELYAPHNALPSGLYNPASTCYVNAALQWLFYSTPAKNAIISLDLGTVENLASRLDDHQRIFMSPKMINDKEISSVHLANGLIELQSLFRQLHAAEHSVVNPKPFLDALGFDYYKQSDAFEVFSGLLVFYASFADAKKYFSTNDVISDNADRIFFDTHLYYQRW
jgi:hypothetical protein